MANAAYGLRPLKYEAETGVFERLNRDDGPVLNDEQVANVLLGAPPRSSLAREFEPAAVIGSADDGDALVAMRGLMIGLTWVLPIWGLIATFIALV